MIREKVQLIDSRRDSSFCRSDGRLYERDESDKVISRATIMRWSGPSKGIIPERWRHAQKIGTMARRYRTHAKGTGLS